MSASQIRQYFAEHLESVMLDAEHLPDAIDAACQTIVQVLLNDGKLVTVGFDAQSFPATRLQQVLLSGLQFDRPPLPTLLISGSPNTAQAQLTSLVGAKDLVLWFTSSPDALPATALQHFRDHHIPVISIGHAPAGEKSVTQSLQIQESAPHKLLEKQLLIAHALSHCIEQQLFGEAL